MPTTNGKSVMSPKLYDLLQTMKDDIFKSVNCAKPATIVSFDADLRTAQVQISFQRLVNDPSSETKIVPYPVLLDCPVWTPVGFKAPIVAGQECIVVFADQNIDAWFDNGGQAVPFDGRRHDLSDGIALVGLNSQANALDIFVDDEETGLGDADAKVAVKVDGGTSKATIANQATDLLTLLKGLIDVIKAIQVTGPLPLTPASIAALEAYKTNLQTLLYTP